MPLFQTDNLQHETDNMLIMPQPLPMPLPMPQLRPLSLFLPLSLLLSLFLSHNLPQIPFQRRLLNPLQLLNLSRSQTQHLYQLLSLSQNRLLSLP
jgi:hypothetical protein